MTPEGWDKTATMSLRSDGAAGPNALFHIEREIEEHLNEINRLRDLRRACEGYMPPAVHEAVIQSLRRGRDRGPF